MDRNLSAPCMLRLQPIWTISEYRGSIWNRLHWCLVAPCRISTGILTYIFESCKRLDCSRSNTFRNPAACIQAVSRRRRRTDPKPSGVPCRLILAHVGAPFLLHSCFLRFCNMTILQAFCWLASGLPCLDRLVRHTRSRGTRSEADVQTISVSMIYCLAIFVSPPSTRYLSIATAVIHLSIVCS